MIIGGVQAVYELEAQVGELAAEKERLQAEVVRQRASLSKNRVSASSSPHGSLNGCHFLQQQDCIGLETLNAGIRSV